jgi:peptidoglycan/xylan/chitin deacetylase (PgdA/CDA1 family)
MKRKMVGVAISALGISSALLGLRRLTRTPWITVLTYHRVGPGPSVSRIDANVVTVSAEVFDRQLDLIKRHFDVVTVEDIVLALDGGTPLPRSPLLVTFDDGYRDNHDVALPLLRKHGLKATFFIATRFVDERRLFWWDRINYLLKASTKERVELLYPYRTMLQLGDRRAKAITSALRIVKEHEGLDLERFLEELAAAAGVRFDRAIETALADEHILGWRDVRALHRAGMSVQSHTHTHRVIQTLSPEELDAELATSRRLLESALDARVAAIAYPVGRKPVCARTIRDAVRRAGYALAFSNRSGINPLSQFDVLDANRLTIDTSISEREFEAIMAVPALAY